MNVVVGKSLHHHTPIFIEEMKYVVSRPYWNVPYSIAVRESVPRARKDPGYIEKHRFEIVASGGPNATALPPTPENLASVIHKVLVAALPDGMFDRLRLYQDADLYVDVVGQVSA